MNSKVVFWAFQNFLVDDFMSLIAIYRSGVVGEIFFFCCPGGGVDVVGTSELHTKVLLPTCIWGTLQVVVSSFFMCAAYPRT